MRSDDRSVARGRRTKSHRTSATASKLRTPPPAELEAWTLDGDHGRLVLFTFASSARAIPLTLTATEKEVAGYALAGMSNDEIARARRTSRNTVANQLASVYRKLGVSSRLELAFRCATRNGEALGPETEAELKMGQNLRSSGVPRRPFGVRRRRSDRF